MFKTHIKLNNLVLFHNIQTVSFCVLQNINFKTLESHAQNNQFLLTKLLIKLSWFKKLVKYNAVKCDAQELVKLNFP